MRTQVLTRRKLIVYYVGLLVCFMLSDGYVRICIYVIVLFVSLSLSCIFVPGIFLYFAYVYILLYPFSNHPLSLFVFVVRCLFYHSYLFIQCPGLFIVFSDIYLP